MNQDLYRELGERVAARRRSQKLTQNELASRSGLSRASIASIESGRQNVLLHHVYDLAAALKIEKVADLLPSAKRSEGDEVRISGEDVTASAKAQIGEMVAAALARRQPKST